MVRKRRRPEDFGLAAAQRQRDRDEGPDPFRRQEDPRGNVVGYQGLGSHAGEFVPRREAGDYALRRCGLRREGEVPREVLALLEEYYFSGDWMPEAVPWGSL